MIKLQNVSKSLGGTPVLKDLSFDLPSGHSLALLGLSGSGKTTALKLIAGLHLPDKGTITAGKITVTKESLAEVRSKIGYVIQDGGLFPHLTARKNISLVGEEAGLTPQEISKRITELSRMTKLSEEFLDRFPRELSGGQRQRVGIMRALLLDPEILLLDEPMGALDPITRNELQSEMKDLIQRLNKTVVLVTHDLFEAKFLAEKIILLNEGSIVQAGKLEELLDTPANDFVRKFVEAQKNHREDA